VPATESTGGGERRPGDASGQPDQRDATAITVLAVVLTIGTGATDVASFTRLGDVFTSVITGNLVLLGLAIGELSGALATHAVVAFAGYMAGVAIGARLVPAGPAPGPWHRALPAPLLVELVLLAGFTVGWELTSGAPGGAAQLVLLAVAAVAMGTQSAAARGFGGSVSTTYLTSTLITVVAAWVTPGRSVMMHRREVLLLVGLAGGAALGGVVIAHAPAALPAIPVAALVLVIAAALLWDHRSAIRSRWPGRHR
jgi:uncharacterized membrane protein YoaK (UPF0700 family)